MWAQLFSTDASSMYTNIDMTLGITAISLFSYLYRDKLPLYIPTELFIGILPTVMENNIFGFGNSFRLETSGTAMGTPCACAYAMISFG
jgi:hypothetical protein